MESFLKTSASKAPIDPEKAKYEAIGALGSRPAKIPRLAGGLSALLMRYLDGTIAGHEKTAGVPVPMQRMLAKVRGKASDWKPAEKPVPGPGETDDNLTEGEGEEDSTPWRKQPPPKRPNLSSVPAAAPSAAAPAGPSTSNEPLVAPRFHMALRKCGKAPRK